jgi:RNA polymerase sigma-70 factor (sigma-E family)
MTLEAADFTTFVRTHSRSLYGTAYLLTGNPDAAEDLLQDTLAALFPKWTRVAEAERSVAYVRRALANRFISARRRPSARELAVWELPDGPADLDVAVVVADRRLLWQLLLTLPERQRAALVLRYFHDLPDAEIAPALGCREVTVRSLISRGLATLRTRAIETERRGSEHR